MGPTTQVIPGSKRKAVAEAKDLKPRSVRFFRYTGRAPPPLANHRPQQTTAHGSHARHKSGGERVASLHPQQPDPPQPTHPPTPKWRNPHTTMAASEAVRQVTLAVEWPCLPVHASARKGSAGKGPQRLSTPSAAAIYGGKDAGAGW
ncbi:hypothetical protein Ssi02_29210 [Sinosporangium siamense]|uniref:Uncharacterized protein n=1 Tax=Sinosporangium siamense TaxID=1367973 RepID=A0A919RH45_9ACTN|nr:hypothetical protein Ssi02_29210 [Sinosporangium siamense]